MSSTVASAYSEMAHFWMSRMDSNDIRARVLPIEQTDAQALIQQSRDLRIVGYNWKTDGQNATKRVGVTADDMRNAFPNLVDGADFVSASELIPISILAVQSILDSPPQGPEGPRGDKGDKGDKGERGDTGANGAQGPKGDKGDRGIDGTNRAQGQKGDKGDRGDRGTDGANREQGPKGDRGTDGANRAQGPKGDKGDRGDRGIDGANRAQGPKGDKGAKGDRGTDGANGAQGPKGDKGDKRGPEPGPGQHPVIKTVKLDQNAADPRLVIMS